MPSGPLVAVAAAAALLLCDCGSPTSAGDRVPDGVWGSDRASLAVTDTGATLDILGAGDCIGSYGEIPQRIPGGTFDVSGTFTQLIGAYPGHIDYAARFTGTSAADQITIAITVPALQQSLGPFTLARGVQNSWPMCLYP